MKLLGDVSDEHRELAEELTKFEHSVDTSEMSNDRKAQCYVCMAHDWYGMSMDEEGNRLLMKAEGRYPGYFKEKVKEHIEESKDFDKLVRNITIELLFLFTSQLKERVDCK